MRVFVTGATGWVGSAVVKELRATGHEVTGLARTPEGALKLQELGATAHVGTLDQHDLLRRAAAQSDGVIHTAFLHKLAHMSLTTRLRLFAGAFNGGIVASFMRVMLECERRAVHALGSGLAGSQRPLVVTSGLLYLPPGRVSTEQDTHLNDRPTRAASETAALEWLPGGVRACIVRLPPTVHGAGDQGFIRHIVKAARKKKISVYIGDGANRWPAVHRLDAARLFRLALERGKPGARYHGAGETGIAFRDIASTIATQLKIPAASVPTPGSARHLGVLSRFVALDNPSSSDWTRQTLGWAPEQPNLLTDMKAHYF